MRISERKRSDTKVSYPVFSKPGSTFNSLIWFWNVGCKYWCYRDFELRSNKSHAVKLFYLHR